MPFLACLATCSAFLQESRPHVLTCYLLMCVGVSFTPVGILIPAMHLLFLMPSPISITAGILPDPACDLPISKVYRLSQMSHHSLSSCIIGVCMHHTISAGDMTPYAQTSGPYACLGPAGILPVPAVVWPGHATASSCEFVNALFMHQLSSCQFVSVLFMHQLFYCR